MNANRIFWVGRVLAAVAATAILGFAVPGRAQLPERVLKSFGNVSQSGSNPTGLLVGADGNLYGITHAGGLYNFGTVFRANPDGSGYDVLRAFGSNNLDAQTPVALLQARDGMLYGLTSAGGDNGHGVIFRLATDGSGYTNLHSFGTILNDAYVPESLIQGSDGLLYGVAQSGGSNYYGAAFKLATNGSAYQVFYSFGNDLVSTSSNSFYADGTSPVAIMQGADGALYGVTQQDGSNAVGVVYKMTTNGSGFGTLYDFGASANDAQAPVGLAQGTNGFLFGVAGGGSSQMGAIFELSTNGGGYAVLHSFTGASGDGATPGFGMMLGRDGAWYGTTLFGGGDQSAGTAFRMNGDGSGYEVIRRFDVITSLFYDIFGTDGQEPGPLAQGANGMLYGATIYGGTTGQGASLGSGAGTLFTLATNASSYAVICDFSGSGGDGQMPVGDLWPGADGYFYGATQSGGPGGQGSVFRVNSSGGSYQIIHGFGLDPIDGYIPQGGLRQGPDGMLYGTTAEGGYGGGNGFGTVFKLSPDGSQFTQVVSFGFWSPSGQAPTSPPWPGRDGYLYGTTSDGGYLSGYGGYGIIYKVGTNGLNYSVLHKFDTNDAEGRTPYGGLIQGNDGTLYGTAYGGESYTGTRKVAGTVFKILTNGLGFQVIHTFTNGPGDGSGPYAGVILGADGFLYGTTQSGGTNSRGTVFKLSVDGNTYQVLYSFGSVANDGFGPTAGVVQGSDGFLYGTTQFGGSGYGVAFKVSTNGGGYTVLYNFATGPGDGQTPAGGLVQGSDGGFFGMTAAGGLANFGTVFRLGQPPFAFTTLSRLPNQTVFMSLAGSSNTTCRIDVSTNFVNWLTLTNLQNSNGAVQFIDSAAPGHPRRFYRAYQSAP